MIKGNESDVANIDLSYRLKQVTYIPMFYIVPKFKDLLISFEPDVGL